MSLFGTIGAIAGGAVGSLVAPGVGTALGASLGGALGNAGGKALTSSKPAPRPAASGPVYASPAASIAPRAVSRQPGYSDITASATG